MLKHILKLAVILLCVSSLVACSDEDKLESRFEFQLGSFEFPQGDDEWDHKIVEISKLTMPESYTRILQVTI